MLKFTAEQQAYMKNLRKLHTNQHKLLAKQHGLPLQPNAAQAQHMVANASPLPKDVWGEWDREGITIQREVLSVFNDLAATVTTPMPIGKLVHYFQTVSDSGNINISLDGRSEAKTDQQLIEYHGTPLPIIDSTFSYGWRQVLAAQTEGMALDGAGRDNAQRRVAEKLESLTLNGDSKIRVGDSRLYGLRNHPARGVRTTGVALNGATGVQWQGEVKALLKVLHTGQYKAAATIYVNWDDWFYAGTTDFSTQYAGKSVAQKVQEMPGVASIVPSDSVPANEMIAVVKQRSVVQLLSGMPMTSRAKFRQDPEDDYNFKVMAAAALEIKFTAKEQCGVAHSEAA